MNKTNLYSLTALSFSATMLDFFLINGDMLYFPRDRIIHNAISVLAAGGTAVLLNFINKDNTVFKITAAVIIALKALITAKEFIGYYNSFHGADTFAIICFTAMIIIAFFKLLYKRTHCLYSLFVFINVSILILTVILCIDKFNVANIYTETAFDFKYNKLFVFFNILPIYIIAEDKKKEFSAQKSYLLLSFAVIAFITVLQGLCINGNMLYRLSPLQALVQIFYTDTVARFDYCFTILQSFNYFASVILYSWAIGALLNRRKYVHGKNY